MVDTRAICAFVLAVLVAGCGGGPEEAALGTVIEVGYQDASDGQTFTTLDVAVLGVRQGTVEELEDAGLEFDEEERGLTPWYVDARYANTGENAVERSMRITLEDGPGNLLSPTIIFDFSGGEEAPSGPCPAINDGELAPGEEFEDCTLFLVPPDIEPARVTFLSQPEGVEPEFVYWATE